MKIINKQPIAFIKNLTKAYTEGVYADTPQNKKLGRVGMTYAQYAAKSKKDSSDKKTWDKIEAFYKKESDENRLWDSWYKFQKSGDYSHISDMRQILEKKFPDIESWKQTSPNTGKAKLTALNKDGDKIASIKLDGDKVDLAALQTFMDKCYIGKTETEVLVDKTETLKNAEGKRLDAIIEYSNSAKEEGVEGIKVADDATDEEKKIAIAKFYKEAAEGDADNLDEIVEEALADYVPEENVGKITSFEEIPFKERDTRSGTYEEVELEDGYVLGYPPERMNPSLTYYIAKKDNNGHYYDKKKVSKKEAVKIYNERKKVSLSDFKDSRKKI